MTQAAAEGSVFYPDDLTGVFMSGLMDTVQNRANSRHLILDWLEFNFQTKVLIVAL